MKQVVQRYRDGRVEVLDVPRPSLSPGRILVQTARSVVSLGTERTSLALGRQSLLGKAKSRPDQVKQVFDTVRQRGVRETARIVREKLEAPSPLGYSSAGEVVEIGAGVSGFRAGMRVACGGVGYANHAEFAVVPRRLLVPVPDAVSSEEAAFATIGSIAVWGARRSGATLGEVVVVVGLGLVGLLSVQVLRAMGARVVGVDLDPEKAERARSLGAEAAVSDESKARSSLDRLGAVSGADAVVVTAGSSDASPVEMAGALLRDRGRVVIVGQTRVDLPWKVYYRKEAEVAFSRSYGPGRYDPNYEEKGIDLPDSYVRWTEERNLKEFLRLVASREVLIDPLVTHRFPFSSAETVYQDLMEGKLGGALGIVFEYGGDGAKKERETPATLALPVSARGTEPRESGAAFEGGEEARPSRGTLGIGLIGAGNFARSQLVPFLRDGNRCRLVGIATKTGLTARDVGFRSSFEYATTDVDRIFEDDTVGAVLIATRHADHADLVLRAMQSGKKVFVEKPLCLTEEELGRIEATRAEVGGEVMVGFNRRFAPLFKEIADSLPPGPKSIHYRINAGPLSPESWYRDPEVGGGRVLGEICHFLDLLAVIAGSEPRRIYAESIGEVGSTPETVVVTVSFSDGSGSTLHYTSLGHSSCPKEVLEVFGGGEAFCLENFRRLTIYSGRRKKVVRGRGVDKGHRDEVAAFLRAASEGRPLPIPFVEAVSATRASFAVLRSLREGRAVDLAGWAPGDSGCERGVAASASPEIEARPVSSRGLGLLSEGHENGVGNRSSR